MNALNPSRTSSSPFSRFQLIQTIIAAILSKLGGAPVPYIEISEQEYIANGLPQSVAEFALAWVRGINWGEWGEQTGDLERLIGHKPTTIEEYLREHYHQVPPEQDESNRAV